MDYNLSNLSCKRLEESYLPVARPEIAKKIRRRLRQRETSKKDFIDEAVDFWKEYLPLEVVKIDPFLK